MGIRHLFPSPLAYWKRHTVFSDDAVGVRASVSMDVIDGFVEIVHQLDGALQAAVFGAQRLRRRRTERQLLAERRTGKDFDL